MPPPKKIILRNRSNLSKRSIDKETEDNTNIMVLDENTNTQDDLINKFDFSCQTGTTMLDFSCQVDIPIEPKRKVQSEFQQSIDLNSISVLADIFREYCGQWDSVSNRIFSVLLYLTLRFYDINYSVVSDFLKCLNCNSIQRVHGWCLTILEEGTFVILRDKRGGYRKEELYEMYPDLEIEAKLYAMEKLSLKTCAFDVLDLAKFITSRFEEIIDEKPDNNQLIRSVSSCRLDLIRWGAVCDKNKNRPYFEGHERDDVVDHRKVFIKYFLLNRDCYYQQETTFDKWILPYNDNAKVLICHDESTFRSGEMYHKRWLFPSSAPFYNKGLGRSLMLSYFLVQCEHTDLFELNENEYQEAIHQHPDLLKSTASIAYNLRSANAYIEPSKDGYFNNDTILEQFERLFILLRFKNAYKDKKIEILVDNARTHTAKRYDPMLLNKNSGTNCPYETIEWIENDEKKVVECFLDKEKTKSKGLFLIAKELNLIEETANLKTYKLEELRTIISKHPAFVAKSKLEHLAKSYDIEIVFIPKYHCELNPIEGLWCYMKQYIRKRTDQNFDTLKILIPQAIDTFREKNINFKLWRRFWNCLEMYYRDYSYQDVLQSLFGTRSKGDITSHRVIYSYD